MLNINLNLPTLPTQDQKDAMDNASTPDATNVFITANDLTIPTLQEVTDSGNTTTNDIQFGAGVGVLLNNTSRLREGTIDAGFGGTKGIAQICAVGYELKWEAGRLYVMDGNGLLIRHSLHNFTTVPSANDDATKGYYVGSLWTLDNGVCYICTDSTTASATWDLYEATPQVNSDWNAVSGVAEILNKPSIPAAQIQSDWNQTNNTLLDYIKNKPTVGSGDMTKAVYDTDNSGIVDNAEAIIIIGRNSTGATLRKGTIIYISGSTGNRPNFVKAKADSEATSAGTFGVIVNDISNNSDGNCCVLGYLDTLDTRTTATYPFTNDTLADGDTIYLSPTTAGYITNVKPSAPNHLVYLGKVTRTSPTNGTIIYRIQNGYELNEIHDVAISSVADKDLLSYESSTSLWKNKSASALGIVETTDSIFNNAGEWIQLTGPVVSPADSTNYNIPQIYIIPSNSATARQFKFAQSGNVKIITLNMNQSGNGSSELSTVYLRNNTTGVDNLVGTFALDGGVNANTFVKYSVNIAVNDSDAYILKISTPAWVTNPTSVYFAVRIFNKS